MRTFQFLSCLLHLEDFRWRGAAAAESNSGIKNKKKKRLENEKKNYLGRVVRGPMWKALLGETWGGRMCDFS